MIVGLLFFAAQQGEETGEIAENARFGPCFVGVVLQVIDDRPGHFHHEIMPVITVFAANVHATNEGDLLVDDRGFSVIASSPGDCTAAEFYPGAAFHVLLHRQWTLVTMW